MTKYHAVMLGEDGQEFGADVTADSYDEAEEKLSDDYPESSIIQLESPEDRDKREFNLYADVWGDEMEYEDVY